MKPGTVALRDAIVAALQTGHTLTTHEVVAAVFADGAMWPYRHYSRVYSNLRALERQGVVSWVPSNGMTSTLWASRPMTDDLAQLESMWRFHE